MEIRRPDFDGRDFEALILITEKDITFCNVSEYEKVKSLGTVYRANLFSVAKVSGDYPHKISDEKIEKLMRLTDAYYTYMNFKIHPYLLDD